MADIFSAQKRSEIMGSIRSKDTNPEKLIRSRLHKLGYRYRLYLNGLPGRPDIVFPRYKTIVQVRGCFWHQHSCKISHVPQSKLGYWRKKLARNIERDRVNDRKLRRMGWHVLIIWECQCRKSIKLMKTISRIDRYLKDHPPFPTV